MDETSIQPLFFAMASQKRKFTDEQRLEILRQAKEMGVTAALRHHSLSYSVFARWREKFMKKDGSRQEFIGNKARSELKQYIEDNTRLKKIIADLVVELERRDEELKKTNSLYSKR